MVVSADFMPMGVVGTRMAVPKHKDHLTLYIHLLPIPKNGPSIPMSIDAIEELRKKPTYNEDVR